jgi:hypothetical protein
MLLLLLCGFSRSFAQTRYEAENSQLSNATTASANSGYSGTGYVTGLTSEWSKIQFDVGVSSDNNARVDIRYANGTGSAITNFAFYVGSQQIQSLSFAPTGSWSTWATVSVTFALPTGYQNLSIKSLSNSATSVNIDYTDLTQNVSAAPGSFSQSSPASNATGVSTQPTFSWASSASANTYSLIVSTNSSFASPVINQTALTSTSFTPSSALANSTTYFWKVTAVNASGSTVASNAGISFTTTAPVPAPGSFTQTVPADAATNVSATPAFSWAASSNAASYSLTVSTNSSFTSPIINQTGITSTSYTSATSLAASTQYYWKVTAVNATGSTVATNAGISFTTAAALPAPGSFTQSAPASSATSVSVTPTFSWSSSSNATSYTLVVSTNSSYTNPIINTSNITTTSHTSGTSLSNSTTYYWKVTAVNASGSTIASNAGLSFTTVAASSGGTRYQAESMQLSNATVSSVNSGYSGTGYVTGLTSEWSKLQFDVGISNDTNAEAVIRYANGNATSDTHFAFFIGSQRVQGITLPSTGSWSTWSSVTITFPVSAGYQNLIIDAEANVSTAANIDYVDLTTGIVIPPGSFSQSAPANSAANLSITPTFTWTSSSNATSYTLVVSTSSSFASPVINQSGINGTSYTPTTALANSTTYYWKVTAVNSGSSTIATNAGISFSTAAPLPLPGTFNQTSPAASATAVSNTPTFTWGASSNVESYSLIVATNSSFTSPVINQSGLTTTSFTPGTPLGSSTLYYWRVTAVNATGTRIATNAGIAFTTQALPAPGAFNQTAPVSGATAVSRTPLFTWAASTNAASYAIVVSTNSSFTSPAINVSGITSTSYSHSSSLAGSTLYYWRVTATNASGNTIATNSGISFTTSATTGTYYYVSTTGVDAVGRGGSSNPFRTIAYAAQQVPAGQNNTIYLNAGTYSETQAIKLPLGVNLEGAGESSVTITSAGPIPAPGVDQSSGDWKLWYDGSLIQLASPSYNNDIALKYGSPAEMTPAANGNQILSGFTCDGNNKQIKAGVWVQNRNNVTMHHVTFKNFQMRGAVFGRSDMWWYVPLPDGKWMNNTIIHDCTFTNSGADLGGESLGNLCLAGLDGADIYNITINESQGYGIKFIFVGHYRNVKIHDCNITVPESDPLWSEDISIEMWNFSYGNEIYNITCNTWLSMVNDVHFNDYNPTPTNPSNLKIKNVRMVDQDGSSGKEAIECALSGVEISDCYVQDKGFGVAIWGGAGWGGSIQIHDVLIHHNIFANVLRTPGFGFGNSSGVFVPDPVNTIKIYNNVFDRMGNGVQLNGTGFDVKNNAFLFTEGADVEGGSGVTFNNNLKYHTNSTKANFVGNTSGSNNVTGNPGYQNTGARWDTYYKPSSSASFAVNKGTNVGFPYVGSAPDIGRWEFGATGRIATYHEPVEVISETEVRMYPNPSHGTMYLDTQLKIHQIQIVNMQGRIVFQKNDVEKGNHLIDISECADDLYLVKVQHEKGLTTKKILLAR